MGKVTEPNGQAVPYALISALRQQKGTYSDSSGQFTWAPVAGEDSVRVSSVGYVARFIALSQLRGKVILVPDTVARTPVTISAKQRTRGIRIGLGPSSLPSYSFGLPGACVVVVEDSLTMAGRLQAVQIHFGNSRTKFVTGRTVGRIVVYDKHVRGGPGKLIYRSAQLVRFPESKGPLEILLPANDAPWLQTGPILFGIEIMGNEDETGKIIPEQFSRMVRANGRSGGKRSWFQNQGGPWTQGKPMFDVVVDAAISARLSVVAE